MYSSYSSNGTTIGVTLLTYALLMSFVALLVISIMTPVGIQLHHVFQTVQLVLARAASL